MKQPIFDRRDYPDDLIQEKWSAEDGWPLRKTQWPSPPTKLRGSILFQTGRGDMIEKYLESCNHWWAQGWNITAFDWRGQGGSGRFLADPHVGHVEDFGQWTADLAAFVADWKATQPGPHIIMGHSMGGHLVLRTLLEQTISVDAAVLISPMLGFESPVVPVSWIAALVSAFSEVAPERLAWKKNERPSLPGTDRQRFLTHDVLRYQDELWWQAKKPELVLGPPSLKWLAEAYRSTLWTAKPGRLETVDVPLLIIGTEGDRLVSPAAIHRFARRIPAARLKMFGKTVAHEILREIDVVRDEALHLIDEFLDGVVLPR
jgi:lysophospholipase